MARFAPVVPFFMHRAIFYLEYLLFRALALCVNCLSDFDTMRLAEKLGALLFHLLKERREIALSNLRVAFGSEKSEEEIQKIARASMQNLVKVTLEFVRIPRICKKPSLAIDLQKRENVWNALGKKKGLIVTVSHFANWELMGVSAASAGFPIHAIARPVKNPFVYNYIKHLRGITGLKTVDKAGAARATIKLLKQNQMVAILIDQHERQGGIWVDFFGRKACTTSLVATLALKYDVSVIPTYFYREEPERSVLYFGEPFPVIRTGNYEADVVANTQQYVSHIEGKIRKRPGDWLWMHRRWREMADEK